MLSRPQSSLPICRRTRLAVLILWPILLFSAGLGAEDAAPDPKNEKPQPTADSPAQDTSDREQLPGTLELHDAQRIYRELYPLSLEYRSMLQVLEANYGSAEGIGSPESKPSAEPAKDASTEVELKECPANAYLEYSHHRFLEALTTIRQCVAMQRTALKHYAEAMHADTAKITDRLSDRIQTLMSAGTYSEEAVPTRKLEKGRNLLKFSLDASRQAGDYLEEDHPESAITRLRVARFQAIQGLIVLETSYQGEQKLKKEFETALLDAEGKVQQKLIDESQYRTSKQKKENPSP